MSDVLATALALAGMGWRIVPELWREEDQRTIPVIRHWPEKASADADQIRIWHDLWPEMVIGAIPPPGVSVLDIDRHGAHDGMATIARLEAEYGALPSTWTALTPRGGQHRIFRGHPGWSLLHAVGAGDGIDLITRKITLPPAPARGDRAARVWERFDGEPALWPKSWRGFVCVAPAKAPESRPQAAALVRAGDSSSAPLRYALAALESACERIRSCPMGEGDMTVSREAYGIGQIAGRAGLSQAHAIASLQASMAGWTWKMGSDHERFMRKVQRAFEQGTAKPRDIPSPYSQMRIAARNGISVPASLEAAARQEDAADPRPIIRDDLELHDAVDAAAQALCADKHIFQRGGELMRVVVMDGADPVLEPIKENGLATHLSRVARWVRDGRRGPIPIRPPMQIVRGVRELGEWPGVPEVRWLSPDPVVRADGTLFAGPGYDAATGAYLSGTPRLPENERPSHADAVRAANRLADIFADFPLVDKEKSTSGIAAIVAACATGACRSLIRGPTPMFLVVANAAGTGKTLLASAIMAISLGYIPGAAQIRDNPEESAKMLLSIAMSGKRLIFVDNLGASGFGDANWDAALTSARVSGRPLSSNAYIDLPLRCMWIGTGNNVQLRGDTPRRVIPIRLQTDEVNPQRRDLSGFRHQRLLDHVLANRNALFEDAQTIVRAYLLAGSPRVDQTATGYGEWDATIRAAVRWCGFDEFGTAVDGDTADAQELAALTHLASMWSMHIPIGVEEPASRILSIARMAAAHSPELLEAIRALCPRSWKPEDSAAFQRALLQRRNRVVELPDHECGYGEPPITRYRISGKATVQGYTWKLEKIGAHRLA